MTPKIRKLYMSWRRGRSHRRILVGEVSLSADSVTFQYIPSGVKEAQQYGFTCYPDFPDTSEGKLYDINVARILSLRTNSAERSDIASYYNFWEISTEEAKNPICVLGHTCGSLATDNFEFLAEFESIKGIVLVTELAGLSDRSIPTENLKVGDVLTWKKEPDNEYDDKAVKLFKDGEEIGYVKRIHSHIFYKEGAENLVVTVKSVECNGHIRKAFLLIRYISK